MTPTLIHETPPNSSLPDTALATPNSRKTGRASPAQLVQPVLEKLFELYPRLFGAQFLPLKLGIFQELLALHPEHFKRDALKAALGVHTRSGRYLQKVAAGLPRHNLAGEPGEAVAPEHVYLSIVELFRRRQMRAPQDLQPQLAAQLQSQLRAAFEASGMARADYLARIQLHQAEPHPALLEALAAHDQHLARQEAQYRAYVASGETVAAFAQMYGLDAKDVQAAIDRHQWVAVAMVATP